MSATDDTEFSERRRNYIRNLQNPYANLGVEDGEKLHRHTGDVSRSRELSCKDLQNPYAKLSAAWYEEPLPRVEFEVDKREKEVVSKRDFHDEARRILLSYSPVTNDGHRLPQKFREFIREVSDFEPSERARVLSELRLFDISDQGQLTLLFNRERS